MAPARLITSTVRNDPNLEERRLFVLAIVFGMRDAGTSAHHLDIARCRAAFIAKAVAMRDRAFAYEGDDLHVVVRVRRKSLLRRDRVIVPDTDRAPAHAIRVLIAGKTEVVARIEPTVIGSTERGEWANINHGIFHIGGVSSAAGISMR